MFWKKKENKDEILAKLQISILNLNTDLIHEDRKRFINEAINERKKLLKDSKITKEAVIEFILNLLYEDLKLACNSKLINMVSCLIESGQLIDANLRNIGKAIINCSRDEKSKDKEVLVSILIKQYKQKLLMISRDEILDEFFIDQKSIMEKQSDAFIVNDVTKKTITRLKQADEASLIAYLELLKKRK